MLEEEGKQNVKNEEFSRKWSKPVMEKRRRERINRNLQELKFLVLEALNRDSSRYSKLEKADILEMTVKHLRGIKSQKKAAAIAADPNVLSKYRAGYNECMAEMSHYMMAQDSIDVHMKARILSHLASSCRTASSQGPSIGCCNSPALERTTNGGRAQPKAQGRFPRGHLSTYLMQAPQNLVPVRLPTHLVPVFQGEISNFQNSSPHLSQGSVPTSTALQLRDPLWRPWKPS